MRVVRNHFFVKKLVELRHFNMTYWTGRKEVIDADAPCRDDVLAITMCEEIEMSGKTIHLRAEQCLDCMVRSKGFAGLLSWVLWN